MRGGPGGGFGPEMFLQRLDTNGNGMLDPDEAQGRAREGEPVNYAGSLGS